MKWIRNVVITELGLISFIHCVWALQFTHVCHPDNATVPLVCSSGEWVHIVSESYIPQTDSGGDDGSSCAMDFSGQCSLVRTDMEANCNGPSHGAGCRELVDVAGVRLQKPCFDSVPKVMVRVQYECVDGSQVINLCDGDLAVQSTSPTIHLTSPTFPITDPQNNLCVCRIEGIRLTVSAIEINVNTKLPWDSADQYNSVLTVRNNAQVVWQSSSTCQNCDNIRMLNENLYPLASTNYTNITVTYSNFGLLGQIVWLQVTGLGESLRASCTSSPLPPDRIITTTIPTTSSTTSTTSSTTTPSTTTSTTSTTISSTEASTITSSTSSTETSTQSSTSQDQARSKSTDSTSASPTATTTPTAEIPSSSEVRNTTVTTKISQLLPNQTSTLDMLSTSSQIPNTTSPDIASTSQVSITTSAADQSTLPNLTSTAALLNTSPIPNTISTYALSTLNTSNATSSSAISNTSQTDNTTSFIFIPNVSYTTTHPLLTQQESSETKSTTMKSPIDASVQSIAGNKKEESSTIVILLVVILLVLLVIAVIVAAIVYRKRRRFTYDGKIGFKAFFLSLFHGMVKRNPEENEEKTRDDFHAGSFDNLEMSGKEQPPVRTNESGCAAETVSQGKQPENNSGSCYITSPDVEVYFNSNGNSSETTGDNPYYELESECSGSLESFHASGYHRSDNETANDGGSAGGDIGLMNKSEGLNDTMDTYVIMPDYQNHIVNSGLIHGKAEPSVPLGREGATSLETTMHRHRTSPLSPGHDSMLAPTLPSHHDVTDSVVTEKNDEKNVLKVDDVIEIPNDNKKLTPISGALDKGRLSHKDEKQQETVSIENEQLDLSSTSKLNETTSIGFPQKYLPQNEQTSSLDSGRGNDHNHTDNAHNNTGNAQNHMKNAHNHNARNYRDNVHNHKDNDHNHSDDANNHKDNAHNHRDNSHSHGDNAHNHTDNAHNHTDNAHNHRDYSHSHGDNAHNHTDNAHNHTDNAHNHADNSHRSPSLQNVKDLLNSVHDKEDKRQLRRKLKAQTKEKSQGTQLNIMAKTNEFSPATANTDLTKSLPGSENIIQTPVISPANHKSDTEPKDPNVGQRKSSRSRLVEDLLRKSLEEIKLKRHLEMKTSVVDNAGSSDFSQC